MHRHTPSGLPSGERPCGRWPPGWNIASAARSDEGAMASGDGSPEGQDAGRRLDAKHHSPAGASRDARARAIIEKSLTLRRDRGKITALR